MNISKISFTKPQEGNQNITLTNKLGTVEVDSRDVLKLVMQFLQEQGLHQTVHTMEQETQIHLNSISKTDVPIWDKFYTDVEEGNWDNVLQMIFHHSQYIPKDILFQIMEQMVLECIQMGEEELVHQLLEKYEIFQWMKNTQLDRYSKLVRFLNTFTETNEFDENEAFHFQTKEKRRKYISELLKNRIQIAPKSRLLELLGKALHYEMEHENLNLQSSTLDIFKGEVKKSLSQLQSDQSSTLDQIPIQLDKMIKFGKKSFAQSCAFSPNGEYFVVGSNDGFVEVYDVHTGKLNLNLEYQANEQIMMHEVAITCVTVHYESELLASADEQGNIKIWNIIKGKCLRKLDRVHKAITCLHFSQDGSKILSGSADYSVKLLGLKSGSMLKQFTGHGSFINSIQFINQDSQIMTCCSDGYIRIFDEASTHCVKQFYPCSTLHPQLVSSNTLPAQCTANAMQGKSIHQCILMEWQGKQVLLACNASPFLFLLDASSTETLQVWNSPSNQNDWFLITTSMRREIIYAVAQGQTSQITCFNSGKVIGTIACQHEKEIIGILQHPKENLLLSYSKDGKIKIFK